MTKGEIIDRVQELMQDPSPAARGLAGAWVNLVLDDLASRGLLESLQREESTALIAGNGVSMTVGRDYDLAPNTDKVFKVFIPALGNAGILKKKSSTEFLERMLRDGAAYQSQPEIYMIFGNRTLRIHPVCTTQLAPASPTDLQKLYIWKYKDIEHLVEADEITELKNKHTPLLVRGAFVFGAKFDSQDDYVKAKAEYEQGIAEFQFDQVSDPDRVGQVPYNDN